MDHEEAADRNQRVASFIVKTLSTAASLRHPQTKPATILDEHFRQFAPQYNHSTGGKNPAL
jgi:hypothetical protein